MDEMLIAVIQSNIDDMSISNEYTQGYVDGLKSAIDSIKTIKQFYK